MRTSCLQLALLRRQPWRCLIIHAQPAGQEMYVCHLSSCMQFAASVPVLFFPCGSGPSAPRPDHVVPKLAGLSATTQPHAAPGLPKFIFLVHITTRQYVVTFAVHSRGNRQFFAPHCCVSSPCSACALGHPCNHHTNHLLGIFMFAIYTSASSDCGGVWPGVPVSSPAVIPAAAAGP